MLLTRLRFLILIGLAYVALSASLSTPVIAHDQLLSSTPSVDENFSDAPQEISLQYSAEVMQVGAQVLLTDSEGGSFAVGEPSFDGTSVSAQITDELPEGAYTIAWRVVSSDGHPISGIVPFTVGDAPHNRDAASKADAPVEAAEKPAASQTGMNPIWVRTALVGGGGAAIAFGIYAAVAMRKKK
ncbi:MAG: copper resistance CopC family protein [Brevibacterium yomogidense]